MYYVPYLLVLFILMIFSLPLCAKTVSNIRMATLYNDYIFEIILFCVLLIFCGLRGFVRFDWYNYYPFYEKVPSLFSENIDLSSYFKTNGWEKGYLLYALVCKTFFPNYLSFQFISVFIDFLLLRKVINDYLPTNSKKMAYVFFFAFYGLPIEFDLLRNVKSILIFLIALRYVGVSFVKYLALIILACFFHKFSIIYIPVYFLLKKKWNRKLTIVIWIMGNIIFLLQIPLITSLIIKIVDVLPQNIITISIKYYFASEQYGSAYGITIGWIERQVCFFIAFSNSKKLYNNDKMSHIFFNLFYIYSFIFLFCTDVSIVIERGGMLFASGYWFLFPYIYNFLKKENKVIFLFCLYCLAIIKIYQGHTNIWANYRFMFFDDYEIKKNIFKTY